MSSRNIKDAHPTLQARYKGALRHFKKYVWMAKRFEIKISCVSRTFTEQAKLYAQGRTEPGQIVTYCDGYQNKSKHQKDKNGYSRAIDFFVVNKKTGKAIWKYHPATWLFIKLCKEVGLECGYFWEMKDSFHVQMFDGDR